MGRLILSPSQNPDQFVAPWPLESPCLQHARQLPLLPVLTAALQAGTAASRCGKAADRQDGLGAGGTATATEEEELPSGFSIRSASTQETSSTKRLKEELQRADKSSDGRPAAEVGESVATPSCAASSTWAAGGWVPGGWAPSRWASCQWEAAVQGASRWAGCQWEVAVRDTSRWAGCQWKAAVWESSPVAGGWAELSRADRNKAEASTSAAARGQPSYTDPNPAQTTDKQYCSVLVVAVVAVPVVVAAAVVVVVVVAVAGAVVAKWRR